MTWCTIAIIGAIGFVLAVTVALFLIAVRDNREDDRNEIPIGDR